MESRGAQKKSREAGIHHSDISLFTGPIPAGAALPGSLSGLGEPLQSRRAQRAGGCPQIPPWSICCGCVHIHGTTNDCAFDSVKEGNTRARAHTSICQILAENNGSFLIFSSLEID